MPAACLAALPLPALADGGGPLLLIINGYLFTIGQAWILLVEFLYLRRVWSGLAKGLVFRWTLYANLASALLGALLLPLLWAAVFGLLASLPPIADSAIGGLFWATGTWILGDHTPHPWLAMTVSGVLFVVTYFVTVQVEYRLLGRLAARRVPAVSPVTLGQCYRLNLLSYGGLVLLFVLGVQW